MVNYPKTNFFQKPGKTFLFFSSIAVIIVLFSAGIPFFWDNVSISEYICFYLDDSFQTLIPPIDADFGALTLNAYYVAACCALFGKSLIVCHLAIVPFVLGILWEIKNISLKFIKPGYLPLIYLLLLFDPAFITQLLLMGYDIFLLYFVLLAIRTLLEKKYFLYSLSLLLLATISVRAMFFILSLVLIHAIILFFHERIRPGKSEVLVYIPCIVFLICWGVFHYEKTGWVAINPANIVHSTLNGFQMGFRQFVYVLWKITDSGRIAHWLFCIVCFFAFYKKYRLVKYLKIIMLFLFIPFCVNCIIMIFLSNPIGHKYFLQTFIFLSILTVYFIQKINSKKIQILASVLILLFLFTGNFIYYPQKYGNAWETSLKILPYFSIEKNLKAYVKQQNINPEEVYTYYPITNNHKYTYLQEDFGYADADKKEMNKCPYFIVSNVYNIKNPEEIKNTTKDWLLLKHFGKGQVYMTLYKNPAVGVTE